MTRSLLITICLMAGALAASAQVERVLPRKGASSLEGTAFAVGFMQNEVDGVGTPPRLQIFISSQYDARVRINYPAAPFEQIRLIPANTVHVESVLPSFEASVSEFVQRKMIEITSDVPIVVYVLNTLATSTDTYTAIPIKHLGTQYLTVNMPTDHYRARSTDPTLDTARRTGEFLIMAVEDRTTIEITPRVRTRMNRPPNVPFTIQLDSGETFLVQSAETALGFGDLSGSRINATKNIAVLSGHMRSSVPTNISSSKDHLVEMLPPLQTWGKEYVTTPFAIVEGGDEVRLMTADYDTHIEIVTEEGIIDQWFTQPGEWRDINISRPALYRSDKPFFVMQFMPSSRPVDGTNPYYDPAMVVVPPLDQYVEGALFQFPVLDSIPELGDIQRFFYFINVVADSVSLPTLRVNEWRVRDIAPEIDTQRVPGTSMYWATVRFEPGAYTITADTGYFSGVMYGASYADSYANLFGVAYERLPQDDRTPPVYALEVDCGDVEGMIADVSADTAFLAEVAVQTDRTYNYRWAISNPLDAEGTTQFSAWVRDRTADAQIVIHAYDNKGNGREWLYRYDAPQFDVPNEVVIDVSSGQRTCTIVPVVNSDSTPGRLRSLVFSGDPRFTVESGAVLDSLIQPGDTVYVKICFQPDSTTATGEATLTADLGCGLELEVDIITRTSISLDVPDHDFGSVRIGDTVCADLPIVNDGVVEITVSSIEEAIGATFYLDTSQAVLPVTLQPGDTLWIRVCYTPTSEGANQRIDSVRTSPQLRRSITYTGRGVSPRIPSVVIDWGQCLVGIRNDTTTLLINIGSGTCLVEPGAAFLGEPAFDVAALTTAGQQRLDPARTFTFDAAFTPDRVGSIIDTIPVEVDWAQHQPVYIILKGEGVDATLRTYDIDMGEVFVGRRKDSVVNYLSTEGEVPITVSTVQFRGPDDAAFEVDPMIANLSVLSLNRMISGDLGFIPLRTGRHDMEVVLVHTTGSTSEDTSVIRITGVGIDEPRYDLRASLTGPSVVPACVRADFDVSVENRGTSDVRIDSILASFADQDTVVTGDGATLQPGDVRTYRVSFSMRSGSDGMIRASVYADDSVSIDVEHAVVTQTVPPTVVAEVDPEVTPGDDVGIRITVNQSAIRDVLETIAVDLRVPEDRWVLNAATLTAMITDVDGGPRTVAAAVTGSAGTYRISIQDSVQAPYTVVILAEGTTLWRDIEPIIVEVEAVANECGPSAIDRAVVNIDVCGGNLRSIILGALPQIRVSLVEHPVRGELRLRIESTSDTEIRLDLFSVTGERYPLVDKFPLQKGIRDCNFFASDRAAGFYSLVIGYGSGEFILPVVLVK